MTPEPVQSSDFEVAVLAKMRNGALVRYRQKEGLSQTEAAVRSGISQGRWAKVECMQFKEVSWSCIAIIAEAIGLSIAEVCPPELKGLSLKCDRIGYRRVARAQLEYAQQATARPMLPDPAEELIAKECLQRSVEVALGAMNDRERWIIERRYELNGCERMTYKQLGQAAGLTKERIRQIEADAIHKLRQPIYAQLLKAVVE